MKVLSNAKTNGGNGMKKILCDMCGYEISKEIIFYRPSLFDLRYKVWHSVQVSVNQGDDLCLDCIKKIVMEGKE